MTLRLAVVVYKHISYTNSYKRWLLLLFQSMAGGVSLSMTNIESLSSYLIMYHADIHTSHAVFDNQMVWVESVGFDEDKFLGKSIPVHSVAFGENLAHDICP